MKRLLLFAALFAAVCASAQKLDKETFVYAVKGADTLRLDRYTSLGPDSRMSPCLIFAFGGGFFTGGRDQSHYVPYLEYYARQGWTVVSIDYRRDLKTAVERQTLTTENFAPAFARAIDLAVEDLYDATAYVCAHAAEWHIDPTLIVASGSSAGAITALTGEYGICNGSPQTRRLPAGFDYAGVIAFAGAIFESCDELNWRRNPAPILLFHGDADRNVPYDVVRHAGSGFFGSKYISRQLTERQAPHWLYSAANTDHSLAGRPLFENRREIDTFLEKMVLGRQPLLLETCVTPLDAPAQPKEFVMEDYIRANFIR